MQQLHLIGFTTDLESLIFSTRKGAKSGGFTVDLDERLLSLVEEAVRARSGLAGKGDGEAASELARGRPRPTSTLSPREIQSRLRAGRTVADVAREAGVDEDWIARFAAPVEAEQAQVIAAARRLTFSKPRLGESAQPLGTAVRWNVADRGVRLAEDQFDQCWSAYHLRDSTWVVIFDFMNRKRSQAAEWEVDVRDRELFSRDRLASELAYIEPGRRRRPPSEMFTPEPGPTPPAKPREKAPERPELPLVRVAAPAKKVAKKVAKRPAKKLARKVAKKVAKRKAPSVQRRATPARRPAPRKAAKPARRVAKPARGAAKSVKRTTRSVKRPPAKKATAKKTARRAPARSRRPPVAVAPATKVAPAKAPTDELAQRRLALARGMTVTPSRSRPRPGPRRAAPSAAPAPPPPPEPEPTEAPRTQRPSTAEERAAEERRARRTLAERRAALSAAPPPQRLEPGLDVGSDDDWSDVSRDAEPRVVTIRADRATPPTGSGDGEVVVPAGRPPLRPANPASQPRRRRFGRDR